MIWFFLSKLNKNYTQRINLDFDLIRWGFEGFFATMLYAWLPMQLSALLLVYYCFVFWASKHNEMKSSKFNSIRILEFLIHFIILKTITVLFKELFDYTFLGLYVIYLGLLVLFPLVVVNKVSMMCRIVILMEQVSLWAFKCIIRIRFISARTAILLVSLNSCSFVLETWTFLARFWTSLDKNGIGTVKNGTRLYHWTSGNFLYDNFRILWQIVSERLRYN